MDGVKFHFFCRAAHDGVERSHDGPTITLVTRQWAYCRGGATEHHDWQALDAGATLDELRARSLTDRSARSI